MRKVLFCGVGDRFEGITHYRSLVPARAMDAMAIIQKVSGHVWHHERCDNDQPEVLVMQMPMFKWQLQQMRKAQAEGAVVLANVDDYLPSLPKMHRRGAHQHGNVFTPEIQKIHRKFLATCDGILCSTPWLMEKYKSLNDVYLAPNGLDLARYKVEKPENDTGCVVIGWSGGTGHDVAVAGIAPAVAAVLRERENSLFVSLGVDQTGKLILPGAEAYIGRVKNVQWADDYYLYPRDMACFDIGLAPAEQNDFYRAKSQLRLYELAALGICPVVAPMYDEVDDGVTGFVCSTPGEWESRLKMLVDNPSVVERVARNAKEWAWASVGMDHRVHQWEAAIMAAVARKSPIPQLSS